jgi:hypothetical protein
VKSKKSAVTTTAMTMTDIHTSFIDGLTRTHRPCDAQRTVNSQPKRYVN